MTACFVVQFENGYKASLDPRSGHWRSRAKSLESVLNALYAIENLETDAPMRSLALCVARDFDGTLVQEP